jgi:hypothetical protein
MPTRALLTPVNEGVATKIGRRTFRKQLLPKKEITYKGKKIRFNDEYMQTVLDAFQRGAYDMVPAQLADKDNTHTDDVTRLGGEIKGLELNADGLDAIIELSEDAAKIVDASNLKLGVSGKFVHGFKPGDGRDFPIALKHVLLTTDARMGGMKPWEEVLLATDEDDFLETIDLSEEVFDMPQNNGTGTDVGTTTVQNGTLANLTPKELEAAEAAIAAVQLANEQTNGNVVELTAAQLASNTRIAQLELELATQRFNTEATELIDAGVPPVLVELARPVLESPSAFEIELSNGDTVDTSMVIRAMLDECKGFVELAVERGTATPKTAQEEEDEILLRWASMK